MRFKNYKGFKIKRLELKQEIASEDVSVLWFLDRSGSFSELVNLINSEIDFCDIAGIKRATERKQAMRKELKELEVYSTNEV